MLDELDIGIIKELQEDLPLEARPFQRIALRLGVEESILLARLKFLQDQGIIRRIGAALRHREVGYTANAMVVWIVPEERIKTVGRIMSSFPEVSHCYQRATLPNWPFNLFTMIHSRNREECEVIAAKIAQKTQIHAYQLLFSRVEFKKSSTKYFSERTGGY